MLRFAFSLAVGVGGVVVAFHVFRLPKSPKDRARAFVEKTRSAPVAHRGGTPENTLRALSHSKAKGASGVEVDLVFTKDGHPVLLHDKSVDRTSDGTGLVEELTLEELRQFDFGVKFGYIHAEIIIISFGLSFRV